MSGKLLLEHKDLKKNIKENVSVLLEQIGYGFIGASYEVLEANDLCGLPSGTKWFIDQLFKATIVHRLSQYNANLELFYKLLAELAGVDTFECKNAITSCRKKHFEKVIDKIMEE